MGIFNSKLLVYQRIYAIITPLSSHFWPTINPLLIHYQKVTTNFQELTTKKYHLVIQNRPVCGWKKWCFTWQLCTRGTRPASKDLLIWHSHRHRNVIACGQHWLARHGFQIYLRTQDHLSTSGLSGWMAKSLRTTSGKASSASRSKHRRTRSLSGVPSSTVGATPAEGDACRRACRGAAAVPCCLDEGCAAAVPWRLTGEFPRKSSRSFEAKKILQYTRSAWTRLQTAEGCRMRLGSQIHCSSL